MCGIAGVVGLDLSLESARALVGGMAERIHHRGPDGGGIASHADATLAMKRLAIVDIEHGHQPMATEDGSIVLVYNGEIYNAPELREQLVREGVRFATRSDTEVILRLYERNPDRVEEFLVGMWAFAIHDRRRRVVVLSRDRFGIKPLFIADSGCALAFASELRAFDRSGVFAKCFAIDHDAAHAMLSWSYVPETSTIWTGVKRLAPGSRLTIGLANGARRVRRYWDLVPSADAARITTLDEACDAVDTLLRRSVREHLESDVPIAVFLSGGIDSSLVASYAADASSRSLEAFTIGFREKTFDESPFARATAQMLAVPIHVDVLDEGAARDRIAQTLLAYDEPFGDSSSIATHLLCEHVGRSFKVALGGDGGDEAFAGYKKYRILPVRRALDRVPYARTTVSQALRKLPARRDRTRRWTELLRTLRRVSIGLDGSVSDLQVGLAQVAPLARTETLVRRPTSAEKFVDAARARFDAARGSDLQRVLACELGNALPNDMLVKVDRASMACHLEARVPLLDHRVVEFGLGLDERFTLGQQGKVVLRELHRRRFGRELSERKKQGFGVPVEAWLRGPLDSVCERLFDERRLDRFDVLSSDELSRGRFRRWVQRDAVVVWHAFALAAWCEATIGDGPDAVRQLLSA